MALLASQDFAPKRCLMKVQEEEKALWVLKLWWEGEDCNTGGALRFFDGRL